MKKYLLSFILLFYFMHSAYPYSTAEQITLGTNTVSGTSATWIPISTTATLPVSIYGGSNGQCLVSNGTKAVFTTCSGGSSGLTIGATTISGGTNTYIEYNNNGVLGEYSVTGTGTVAVLSNAPTFLTSATAPFFNATMAATGYEIGGLNGISFPTDTDTANSSIAIGSSSMAGGSGGGWNTAVGANTMVALGTANSNSAFGLGSMKNLTIGNNNNGFGWNSLNKVTVGSDNNCMGNACLASLTSGTANTGIGDGVLGGITTQVGNTALGADVMQIGTSVASSTGVGASALTAATTGINLTAVGYHALFSVQTASGSTAVGYKALGSATGSTNVALGENAGLGVTSGSNNVLIGTNVGTSSVGAGNNNILLGTTYTDVSSSNNFVVAGNGGSIISTTGTGTPSTEAMTIHGALSVPDVSITSPLYIGGTTATSTLTLESTSGSGSGDSIIFETGSQTTQMTIGTQYIVSNLPISGGVSGSTLSLQAASGTTNITIGTTQISTNEKMGIGTANPQTTFEVYNNGVSSDPTIEMLSGGATNYASFGMGRTAVDAKIAIAGATNNFVTGSAAGDAILTDTTGSFWIVANSSGAVNFATGTPTATVKAGISTGGTLMVGTSTPPTATFLSVNGNASLGTYAATATTAPTNGLIVSGGVGMGTSTLRNSAALDVHGTLNVDGATIYFSGLNTSSATQTGTVCSGTGGLLTIDTTTTCLLSSMRFKRNIEPSPFGLAEVMKMKPRTFYYKDDRDDINLKRQQVGFIAEEMQNVVPDLVALQSDGKTPKSVAYQNLTAVLTRAIQEQQAEIDHIREGRDGYRCYGIFWCKD